MHWIAYIAFSGEQGSKGDRGKIGYGVEGRQGIVGPPGKRHNSETTTCNAYFFNEYISSIEDKYQKIDRDGGESYVVNFQSSWP
jgi:hypothetical protein